MVELEINGNALELNKYGSDIKYTIQIADIFDISNVSASYTNSFSIPKTPKNTQIFEQLGIVGDNSTLPYVKTPITMKNYGYDVITKGWLNIKDTTDTYNISIIDGMIDFFKAIENKTMGVDLDLSEFSHEKTPERVIQSFNETEVNMKYIVADYNGKNIGKVNISGTEYTGINVDYLTPSFSVKRLLDIIFNTFGYTYNQTNFELIEGLYITYPLAPAASIALENIGTLTKGNYVSSNFGVKYNRKYIPSQIFWSTSNLNATYLTLLANQIFIFQSGYYSVSGSVEAYWTFFSTPVPMTAAIYLNNNIIGSVNTDPLASVDFSFQFYAEAGSIIEYFVSAPNDNGVFEIRHNSSTVNIFRDTLGEISVNDAFKDFKIKDFFKELLWRSGLTPVIDVLTKNISFYPLSDRLNKDNAIDWTDKYVSRTNENYVNDSYAQKNVFRLQHNKEGDLTGNGNLYVNNENIPDEINLVESKIYAPEIDPYLFVPPTSSSGFTTNKYRLWDKEIQENTEDGVQEVKYKGLSNRFYFLRYKRYQTASFRFVSEALNQLQVGSPRVPYATNENTLFDELILQNYADYSAVLTNFRAYKITLMLSLADVLNLNMLNSYYFKQEANYFFINKITYQDNGLCEGEFVRINNVNQL